MSRLLVLLLLLVLILIAFDPNARQKATALVQDLEHKWNNTVVVTTPASDSDHSVTVSPTATPVPTAVANNDNDETIPNTGGDETSEKPIVQVNWDALNAALKRFWDSLRNIKIDLNPQDNK